MFRQNAQISRPPRPIPPAQPQGGPDSLSKRALLATGEPAFENRLVSRARERFSERRQSA